MALQDAVETKTPEGKTDKLSFGAARRAKEYDVDDYSDSPGQKINRRS